MAGWLGNLAGFLPGADQMSEQDRNALLRQGLLAAGLGILKNNQGNYGKAGPAIGAGLSEGLLALNKGADQLADNRYKQQIMERQMGAPSEFRSYDMMAQAAGHKPGTPGYQDYFKRINGEIARQSSAAIQYRVEKGEDGVPRLIALDPREVGAHVVGDGATYGSGVSGPNPQQDFPALASNFGAQITSLQRSPADNARVGGVPNSQHMSGTAGDFVVPPQAKSAFMAAAQQGGYQAIDEGDHVHLELPPRPLSTPKSSGVNPFVGRRPEDEAAAKAAAEESAKLGLLDDRGTIEAENARQKKVAELAAAREDARITNMPKARSALAGAKRAGESVNRAILQALPNINVWTAGYAGQPLSEVGGSAAADLRASLDTIEANIAFDRLQQMRESSPTGGALGSVSERELTLLGSALTSLKQSQSPAQLRSNLQFLQQQYDKALKQLEADFEADFGGSQTKPSASKSLRFNPATGKIE